MGRNLSNSLGVLQLGLDATEMDVKTAYRMLALLRYHPDKNVPEITGMNRDQAGHIPFQTSEHSELVSEISFVNLTLFTTSCVTIERNRC